MIFLLLSPRALRVALYNSAQRRNTPPLFDATPHATATQRRNASRGNARLSHATATQHTAKVSRNAPWLISAP